MDRKMRAVTKEMVVVGKDIKRGKTKAALKTLLTAKKKNKVLTKIDKNIRDPLIEKCKKDMKTKKK